MFLKRKMDSHQHTPNGFYGTYKLYQHNTIGTNRTWVKPLKMGIQAPTHEICSPQRRAISPASFFKDPRKPPTIAYYAHKES